MKGFWDITTDESAVFYIGNMKHNLKARNPDAKIANALNDALNKIIKDFNLDTDPHEFASLPDPTTTDLCSGGCKNTGWQDGHTDSGWICDVCDRACTCSNPRLDKHPNPTCLIHQGDF